MCQKLVLPVIHIPLFAYGFMILVGFLAASSLARWKARQLGIDPEKIVEFGVWIVLAGIVGARICYVILFYEENFRGQPFWRFFAIWEGGVVFYGGAILGFLVGWWYIRRTGLRVWPVLDICGMCVPLGHAFGRIGCYLNGCCWGWRSVEFLPLSMQRFPPPSPVYHWQRAWGMISEQAGRAEPIHPAQLYASLHGLWICLLLLFYHSRKPREGATAFLYLVLYGLGRFLLEALRADHRPTVTGLSFSQNISVLLVLAGIGGLLWRGLFGREDSRKT